MHPIVQFPDLTEIETISCNAISKSHIKTEFAFGVAAPNQDTTLLKDLGFKHLASMMNWWPSHWGHKRELKFFWLRLEEREPQLPGRLRWCHEPSADPKTGNFYITKDLAASGCGFKLGTPPLQRASYFRFFTLLRMPVKPGKIQQKWLGLNFFRHIDTGAQASYWVNGWEPGQWSMKEELARFKGYTDEQADKGLAIYGYKPL